MTTAEAPTGEVREFAGNTLEVTPVLEGPSSTAHRVVDGEDKGKFYELMDRGDLARRPEAMQWGPNRKEAGLDVGEYQGILYAVHESMPTLEDLSPDFPEED